MSEEEKFTRILADLEMIKGYLFGNPNILGVRRELDAVRHEVDVLKEESADRKRTLKIMLGTAFAQALAFIGVLLKSQFGI